MQSFFQYYAGIGTPGCSKVILAASGGVKSEGAALDEMRLAASAHDPQVFLSMAYMSHVSIYGIHDEMRLAASTPRPACVKGEHLFFSDL